MVGEKECIGAALHNEVDDFIEKIEADSSTAVGKGLMTEDQYNSVIEDVSTIRENNDKIKCILSSIPTVNDTASIIETRTDAGDLTD